MNEEVYLQNLVFKKIHDDKGLVKGEIVFKNRISLEEYTNMQEKKDLILCDKSQNNWNELKKWLEEKGQEYKNEEEKAYPYFYVWKQMQKLEGNNV